MDCKKYQVRSQAVTVLTEERFILSGDGSSQNIARQGKKNNNKKKQTFLQRHIIYATFFHGLHKQTTIFMQIPGQ